MKNNTDKTYNFYLKLCVTGIVLNTVLLILIVFMLVYNNQKDNSFYKRIGNESLGYIDIPNYLYKKEMNNDSISYVNADNWSINLNVIEDPVITAKGYALYIQEVFKAKKYEYISYHRYVKNSIQYNKIIGYDSINDIWICNWIFKETNGDLHIIKIEGPDESSEIFNLIETYNLKG